MRIIEIAQAQVIQNAPTFSSIGASIVNFLLGTVGFFAIIGMVVSAIIYFTAGGNEDQIKLAKRSFFYSIVGIIVALGAMIFINQLHDFLR